MFDKIADVYKNTFTVRTKKRVYHFVAGELLLVFKMCYRCLDREFSVEQSNIYSTVIGQAFHELWQFETRHANARNIHVVLIFYSRSSFLDYAGLRVKIYFTNET